MKFTDNQYEKVSGRSQKLNKFMLRAVMNVTVLASRGASVPGPNGTRISPWAEALRLAKSLTTHCSRYLHRRRTHLRWFVPRIEQLEMRLTLSTVDFRGSFLNVPLTPAVADLNGDGWNDVLGALNDQQGNLVPQSLSAMGLGALFANGRVNRHTAVADFNGDSLLDIVGDTYTDYGDTNSLALLFIQNPNGTFTEDTTFRTMSLRGYGETIVTADFNNDGALDIFLPYYTFPYPDGSGKTNAPQCYLLINDGSGHFTEIAVPAGVSLSNWPDPNLRPEGAQAVDFNGDGLLDLYVASHLFLNNANLTFTDVRQQVGLPLQFDEGAKFLDWNNDGHLDLVLMHPSTGLHLYEFNGTTFTEKTTTVDGKPFFSTGTPGFNTVPFVSAYGMNVYDVNNDGLEDIATMGGTSADNTLFLNTGTGFVRAQLPLSGDGGTSFVGLGNGQSGMSFGDINRDGKIDILYPANGRMRYFVNTTATDAGTGSLSVEVLGPNGERNQQGRVVKVMQPGITMTRVVDGGSGYMAQTQYPILVGSGVCRTH